MARTVKIRGLDDKFETSLCLQNITESPSCYGDAIEESCWHEAEKAFYVTFVDAAVAERVVSSGLTVGGKVLEVMHHQSQPDESGIRCTVEVRGFDPAKQELYLLYFENPNKGGGTVWELKVKEDVMLITFEDPEVAARVASMSHKVGGQVLQVTLAAQEKPCTVKVTGGDLDQEELYTMYFENPRKGGGAISDVTVDRKLQAIFVTFEDPAVAEAVCSTSHRVGGCDLQVTLQGQQRGTGSDQASVGENKETPVSLRTVEVIVHDQLQSEDIYVHYFENRRSGGGEVEEVSINKDKGVVYVTFVRPEVAARVAGQSHKIGNLPMQVRMYVPPRPRPNYPNKLLFKNVANVTTKECLELYLERISGLAVQDVLYGDEPGVVLVSFDASPDFSKIQELCNTRRLDGNYLTVSEVQVTNCVLVEGLAPTTTTDTVCLYFESERSLGGRVEKTEIVHIGSDHNCLVFFEDYEVVDRVLTKTHKIDGRPLRVKRHIDCLGLSGGREDPSTFVLPGPLVLEVDKFKLLFIKQSSVAQGDLTGKVARVNAQLTYTDNNISAECTLTKENSTAYILARTWTQDVQQMVTSYLDQIEVHRTDVGQQVWPEVKKALDAIEVAPDCEAAAFTCAEESAIFVVGETGSSAKLLECITKMVNAVTEETERKKQELTVINHNLKPHQLCLLAAASFPTESSNRHHGLSVDIQTDKQRIIFHGLNHDVKDAQIEMYHLLNSARSEKISGISDRKKKLLENAETCDLVMQKLTSEEIVAVWDVGDVDVTVHAFTDSQVVGAIDAIRKSVTEHFCHMPSSAEWLFSTPEWGKLVKSQTESYSGKVQIVPDQQNQQVVITGTDDIMHIVIREVEDFLQENTACTNLPASSSPGQDKIDTPQPSESAVVGKSSVDELVSDLDLAGGSCCLTCSKSVDVERDASQEHTLQSYIPPVCRDGREQRTVEVTGLTEEHKEICGFYFANKSRSGGGEIDSMTWDEEQQCLLITFTEASAAERVASREHILQKKTVHVQLCSPPVCHDDRVLLKGVPAGTTEDLLQNYLECTTDITVTWVNLDKTSGSAIVKIEPGPLDLKHIDKAFQANPLDSAEMMSVHGVPKVASSTILVENLKPSTSSECISMYFQNRKRNRGGPVRSVEKLSDTTALVHFEECKVAESVVQKTQHSLDGQDLQVTLHQQLPGFGRQPPMTDSFPNRMHNPEEPMDTDDTASVFKTEPGHEDTPKGYGFACVSAERDAHEDPARHYDRHEQQQQQDYTARSSQSRRRSSGSSDEQIHGQERTGFCHSGQPERGGRQREIDPDEVEGNRQPLEMQLRAQPQGHPTHQPAKPLPVQGSPHCPRMQPGCGIQGNQQYGPVGREYHGQYGHPQTGDPHYENNRLEFGAQGGQGMEERGQRTPAKDAYCSSGRGHYWQSGHPQTRNPNSGSNRREYGANGGRGADRGQRAPAGMGYGRGHGHDQRGPYLENASSYPTGQDRRANSTLPGPMCTVVKLGAPVIEQIQEGHGNLRELVSLLKNKFNARHQWKPPDHIIVKPAEGNVLQTWAFEVQTALDTFVLPFKVKLGEGMGLNRSQKTPPEVVSVTSHHPGGKTAAPHAVRERSPRQAEDAERPVETLAAEDSIKLKPHQIKYLCVPQTIEKIETVCSQLQLSLDRKAGVLKMRAVRESAQRAKTHILTILTNIVEDKIPVTEALYQMYSSAAAQEKIQEVTDASGMICYWELPENCISIVALKEDIQRLKQVFNSTFIESRFTIDDDEASVIRSNSWQEFMEHMQQGCGGQPPPVLMPDMTNHAIFICDTPSNIGSTREAIAEFFDENKPEEKTFKFSFSHMKFLSEFCAADLRTVHEEAKELGVSLTINKNGAITKGPRDGLARIGADMQQLVNTIVSDKMTFKTRGAAKYLKGQKGQDFLQSTGQCTKCLITLLDDQSSDDASLATGANRVLAQVDVSPWGKLVIMQGDITQCQVGAIVNSADGNLEHGGSVAAAIVDAGGESIQRESRDIISRMGRTLWDGEVVDTGAGTLPCSHILHAVGPTWRGGFCDEDKTLVRTVMESLKLAQKLELSSVAMPAISCGIFRYPVQKATLTILQSVAHFLSSEQYQGCLSTVILIDRGSEPLKGFLSAARKLFGEKLQVLGEPSASHPPHTGKPPQALKHWDAASDTEETELVERREEQSTDIYIYSTKQDNIKAAQEKIYKHMKANDTERKIEDPLITNLRRDQQSAVSRLQFKHDVEIQLKVREGMVKVKGFGSDVMEAISDIKDIMMKATTERLLAAGMPPVRWQYEAGKDMYHDFDPDVITIEAAYKKREKQVDFSDKRGKWYSSRGDEHASPVKVRHRDLLQEKSQEIPLPSHWEPMKGDKVKLVDLKPSSPEYKRVAENFVGHTKKIQRVQNPTLFQQFKVKKRELEQFNPKGTVNEKRLWHGTSSDVVTSIITNGFNRSYCGKYGTALGVGVYFAANSAVSMGYARGGYVFQTRVLTGEYTQGNGSMRMAPMKPSGNRPYDSVTDGGNPPGVHVIFHDSQAYPEYLLTL